MKNKKHQVLKDHRNAVRKKAIQKARLAMYNQTPSDLFMLERRSGNVLSANQLIGQSWAMVGANLRVALEQVKLELNEKK